MSDLVTLEQAKQHLKLPGTHDDDDLELKREIAQALVLDYVKQRLDGATEWEAEVDAWDEDTVPKQVQAAILMQTAELYRFRGDDETDAQRDPMLSPRVRMLLDRFRDPALA